MTEICEYLHNWFCEDSDKIIGNIVVGDSEITVPYGVIQPGQYIRIIDSVFNNGVWQYGEAGFVPETLDTELYDGVITVENEVAFETSKLIAKKEGILVGISSGAALSGAIEVAKDPANAGKTIVVILPDSGDRYYSTPIFAN